MATADLSGVKLHLVDSVEKAGEMMTWLSERRPHDVIAVDTETGELPGNDRKDAFSPWHGRLRLVQIGDGQTGWSIPWERWNGVFHEAMEKYQGELICHNIAFENKWFMVQSDFRIPWHRAHDTMIMSQIVNPLQSAALKSLTRRYVDSRASGLQQMLDQEMTENGWTWGTIPINNKKYYSYGALDCVLTVRLFEKLRKEIEPYKDVYDMEMAVRRVCSNMEFNGARVDVEYSRAQHERLGMHAQSVRDWVKDAYDINAGSPTQLTKVFVDRLGGVVTETTPSGQPKMDKTQLQKFVIQGEGNELSVLAEQVLRMRKSAKLADTYFANFINGNIDGLMHPEIRTLGARTSRMSITSPALQTLPKGDKLVRKAFIPRNEGEVLVSADLEQVEFRMMAGLSRDPALVNLFQECDRTGDDAFTRIGQEVYNDPSMVKKDPRRAMMKTYVYGCHDTDTKIFTDRGWLTNEEVKVGDKTIGLNLETGKSEWTEITGVHNFPKGELFRFGNKHRSFLCTEDHRWAVMDADGAYSIKHAYEIAGSDMSLVLAADGASKAETREVLDCKNLTLEPHSTAPVWCVTTGLGTWTASQDDDKTGPFITGNTMYGAGVATSAVNAGVPEHQMKEVAAAFNAQYPGVKTFMQQVEHAGMTRLRNEGEAYVKTKLGRRLPADEGRVYTLVNYCLAPNTPILGSDLVHKPAFKVAVGDRLVAFDEYPEEKPDKNGKLHRVRRMRTATVEAVTSVVKPSVRVTVADGRTVDCSSDHLWLVRAKSRKKGVPATTWKPAYDLQPGDRLFSSGHPWEEDESKGAGWLAGLYDGEGCLGTRADGNQSTQLSFAQNAGPVMDRFVVEMERRGFSFTYKERHPSSNSPCQTVHSYGMFPLMRILGTLQPTRFQPRFERIYEGAALTGGTTTFQEVVSIEDIGQKELVSIQTSTRTLIANGLLSHNCIQGGAAEVFKQDMLKADAAGLGDYFVVPVHDELVMSVPRAEAEEAGKVLQECMTTREGWPVELLAGAPEVGLRWGGMVEASSEEGQAIMQEPEEA